MNTYSIEKKGFSLIELLVVIGLIAIVSALAFPSFMQWREGLQYRQVGRELSTMIRTARSRAISANRQQLVDIDVANRLYRLRQGNRAVNTTLGNWVTPTGSGAVANDVLMPTQQISLAIIGRANIANTYRFIICNPNGTMQFTDDLATVVNIPTKDTAVIITIFDNRVALVANQNSQRYRIDLTQTGKITGTQVGASNPYP